MEPELEEYYVFESVSQREVEKRLELGRKKWQMDGMMMRGLLQARKRKY